VPVTHEEHFKSSNKDDTKIQNLSGVENLDNSEIARNVYFLP
jgi:hypothetical protein